MWKGVEEWKKFQEDVGGGDGEEAEADEGFDEGFAEGSFRKLRPQKINIF